MSNTEVTAATATTAVLARTYATALLLVLSFIMMAVPCVGRPAPLHAKTPTKTAPVDSAPIVAAESRRTSVTAAASPIRLERDQRGAMAPGKAIRYALRLTNSAAVALTATVSATSSAGFRVHLTNSQEATVAVVPLASDESTDLVAIVHVSNEAAIGVVDRTTVFARMQVGSIPPSRASLVTTVRPGLAVMPDHTGYAAPGDTLAYHHSVVNSWPETRAVGLTALEASGWEVRFLSAEDSSTIDSVTVGPNGARVHFIASLSVPATISTPATHALGVRATTGTESATATDITFARRLDTYRDPSFDERQDRFRLTEPVFAKASALETSGAVCFVWKNPSGMTVRTSPTASVDASGAAFDAFTTVATDTVGTWSVELRSEDASGSLIETKGFSVSYKGIIASLYASDGPDHGDTITVTASVQNQSSEDITGSVLSYLLWWDGDGNEVFSAGDTYIDALGSPRPYSLDATTHASRITSVPAGQKWIEPSPWSVKNDRFPEEGLYNCTATWWSSDGTLIDQKTAEFYSIPTLGWPLYLLVAGGAGLAMWRARHRRLREAGGLDTSLPHPSRPLARAHPDGLSVSRPHA